MECPNQESAPQYYYLWHLAALKVINANFGPCGNEAGGLERRTVRAKPCPEIHGSVWDLISKKKTPTRGKVALIDVGVSRNHPNLAGNINAKDSIDLTNGRVILRNLEDKGDPSDPSADPAGGFLDKAVTEKLLEKMKLDEDDATYFRQLARSIDRPPGIPGGPTAGDESFASHGTAIAGLIVGKPAKCSGSNGGMNCVQEQNAQASVIPYFGVDPGSELISIKTSFEDDPLQFIAAFHYARQMDVEVIVLPRGIPDPVRTRFDPKHDSDQDLRKWKNHGRENLRSRMQTGGKSTEPNPYRPIDGAASERLWDLLKKLMIGVSEDIPVVCAAGNSGESQLIYPANLAAEDDGSDKKRNGIIAVGAVTAEGFRSGYSNYGPGLTLVAPSDDWEVFNEHQLRIDPFSEAFKRHDFHAGQGKEYAYCHLDLVTTDLLGAFGYSSDGAVLSASTQAGQDVARLGGNYTFFGGTSGAAALVGGVAALVQRAHRARGGEGSLSGIEVKDLLKAASKIDVEVAPGCRKLTPDDMNAFHEHKQDPEHFFGAGLLNAKKAVKAVLNGKRAPKCC